MWHQARTNRGNQILSREGESHFWWRKERLLFMLTAAAVIGGASAVASCAVSVDVPVAMSPI